MLTIDGSFGEGGGQILRSSLALSLLTQTPFRISKIRAGRSRPGLMRQHLTAVRAAAEISDAEVSGAEIGSTEVVFHPKAIRAGDFSFATGGAGSTTLVFQTVLYPLLLGTSASSTVRFEGGTHNPMAPPFDFLNDAFLPQLRKMGANVELALISHGFYPAGGGAWTAAIHPSAHLSRLDLLERGEIRAKRALALVAQISGAIAVREIDAFIAKVGWDRNEGRPHVIRSAHGPGNALVATIESEHVTEVFTGFGERGVSAERVAESVADEVTRYLRIGAPVGEHLADQLLLPMALGSGGSFHTVA
ncbi:MAG: RNA 3'-terminal phosphate cyclase, partial [Polyangiaceae bacterium]